MKPSADVAPASFTVELTTALTPDEALLRILDLRQHDRIIPFTRVTPTMPADELAPGTEFVARTGLGRIGFDDVMRVEEIHIGAPKAEASAVITKRARVIRGTIRLTITTTPASSHVRWHQTVRLPWLPGFAQGPATQVIRLGYRRVLSQLLAADPITEWPPVA